uniref:C3H1-type domain-containing protein n=1 Tax=Alexandrium catenella TaxID=2925 RepID=A0A7S1LHP8_ALECA|mmetsp:Transcript_113847/g.302570  ORF Transcript_113847/g.302570 Transcript_113847/m.302570 type:complete len:338 (+) Transcript_113847:50-1063(+)|eukprot:CAMPEP_0171197416 /NCGR_PEP_ID=MMETSP0790-20130122/22402_1 /TAXON_ID=2925 /ORGANISM="Alexandrium catenella, Strain OF101" /LENGTH=337 /DNA_ID=CAMNT_0011662661 /DNA_START=50 /DNA_END=1063 /DNA_ORIENTATION=+
MAAAPATLPAGDQAPRPQEGSGAGVLSQGTKGHPDSCGLPCKYHWKPRGCKDGLSCARCHLCPWQPLLARGTPGGGGKAAQKPAQQCVPVAPEVKAEVPPQPAPAPAGVTRPARNPASQTRDERLYANALRFKDVSNEELEKLLPLREDGTPSSIGTLLHADGHCTRCIYIDTPKGCPNGVRCKFCHGCHPPKEQNRGQKRSRSDDEDSEAGERRSRSARIVCDENGNSRPSWLRDDFDDAFGPCRYGGQYPPALPHGGPPQPAYGWGPPVQHWTPPAGHGPSYPHWPQTAAPPQQAWPVAGAYPPQGVYGYPGQYWPQSSPHVPPAAEPPRQRPWP